MKKIDCYGLPDRVGLKKVLRIMKLTTFLMLFCLMQSYALSGYSQQTQLTLDVKNRSIEDALYEIEQQSEYVFLYNRGIVDVERKTNMQIKNASIDKVLELMFENSNVGYQVIDRQIVLSVKSQTAQQERTIAGTVSDQGGEPLPGVTVMVKGTSDGTITDFDGKYTLKNVAPGATLVYSFVGMRSQEVVVGNQSSFDVVLEEETIGIEEVVAIGYGSQKKVNLTGSVSNVTSEVLESRPVQNVGQALQGIIPGLNFQTSGLGGGVEPRFKF
ncbi:carboxypeptidase-like regulatory domain-containing protein [uncultured Sunxiuqinia sp.]|uniref:carboxypeptidase-like regulatory domain-containing protein n=1 Tax=uncultured Sunxiuqinia sp. TaxID=1573825 RepID=UPI002629D302|nr:carboxypeptidase-like regulatory domain-containing protein [uncultured Sunxiuqinia sp.]